LWGLVAAGTLDPLVSSQLRLDQLIDGLVALDGRATTGRVMLVPNGA